MNRSALRHGFILILLALVSGMFVQNMQIPRLGLSAHTIGILSGVLLIGLGATWQQFTLTPRQFSIMYWTWLYAGYINWLGCLVGAVFGAGMTTTVASGDYTGTALVENAVAFMLYSVAAASFVAVGLSLWGLRASKQPAASL